MKKAAALAALLLLSCDTADAQPEVTIDGAWARATARGQTNGAVYFTIINRGGPDRLVGVSSPSGGASLHSTSMDGGVMRMRAIESVEIPARSTVDLKPGGPHVMLTGLGEPLNAGTTTMLNVRFDRSGNRQVEVEIRPASTDGVTM